MVESPNPVISPEFNLQSSDSSLMASLISSSPALLPTPLIQRLAQTQLGLASVWLLLLSYLSYQGAFGITPAWVLLSGYLPLQLLTHWCVVQRNTDALPLFMLLCLEAQLATGLLFFTGGVTNPLISYFLILLMMAAYGLPARMLIWFTLLCIGDYSLLGFLYQPIQIPSGNSSLANWHLSGMWLTFVISAIIVTTVIPPLIRARQRQAAEVQALRERQLKNEQLIGIGTLAASTAHDMGTPLMTMNMLLDDLLSQAQSSQQTDPELEEDLQLLQSQVQICRQSLAQLAEQGRSSRPQTIDQSSSIQAQAWLSGLLQRWHLSHPKAVWEMPAEQALSTGTEEHEATSLIPSSPLLDQALLNLLDNAAEAGEQPIQIETRVIKQHWQIDIIQPDPEAASSIDNYQLYQSEKPNGLGIGLFLSNASVEQFGGSIELQKRPQGGSLCQLTLPLVTAPNQPGSKTLNSETYNLRKTDL